MRKHWRRAGPWAVGALALTTGATSACGDGGGAQSVDGVQDSGGSGGPDVGAGGSVFSSGGSAGSGGQGASASAGGHATAGGQAAAGGSADGGSSKVGGASSGGSTGQVGGGPGVGGGGSSDVVPSAGCGKELAMAEGRGEIDVDGVAREYVVHLPNEYDPTHPYRLIFGWHGRQYDADWVANGEAPLTGPFFGMEDASAGDAIFVAPDALSSSWTNENGRDVAFASAMIEKFSSELCVDESRVFSSGFSYGAIMTIRLGCELGTIFRAIAPMSGSLTNGCPDSPGPLAYWASHGTDDTTIAISNGESARDVFLERNHCTSETVPAQPEGCVSYQGCDEGAPVSWCPFEGVHEPAPFAGEAIWAFFSQF